MSPVFRHGRLRLYLLKLLDEAPRHGYEVIRLLQDRFLGVYAPSPGTIYPRLARLEEEGLVTHDEADGRKVYRITEKGRQELNARLDDLAELEEEITASVRDIAREVSEDVRETVRSLREELTSAARDIHGTLHQPGSPRARQAGHAQQPDSSAQQAGQAQQPDSSAQQAEGSAQQAGQARQAEGKRRGPAGAGPAQHEEARSGDEGAWAGGRAGRSGRSRGGRGGPGWGDWPGWPGWTGWGAGQGWPGGPGGRGWPHEGGHRLHRDLERLARRFTRELKMAAWQAQAVSEDALAELRDILDETLDRIRSEVFEGRPGGGHAPPSGDAGAGPAQEADGPPPAGRPEPPGDPGP